MSRPHDDELLAALRAETRHYGRSPDEILSGLERDEILRRVERSTRRGLDAGEMLVLVLVVGGFLYLAAATAAAYFFGALS